MSIPLDKLYDYLEDVSGDDVLIYRWKNPGDKNLLDVECRKHGAQPYVDKLTKACMIMHDQEPLNFGYLQSQPRPMDPWISNVVATFPEFWQVVDQIPNLRLCIPKLNVHDKVLICHSEKNSRELEQNSQHFIGVYMWSHALIAADWYRYAQHDPGLVYNFDNFRYDFLIYSRAWSSTREYRIKFAELLIDNELTKSCLTSFGFVDNNVHYSQHQYRNPEFNIKRSDLEKYFRPNTFSATASADYSAGDYQCCGIEIVLETLFDDARHHLTEKTLRPIACKKPFMLAGTAGSLQYLRDYGFKTFHPYINEHYDTIPDSVQRLQAVVAEMKRIGSLSSQEKTALWRNLQSVVDYNHQLFFSSNWQDTIVNEYLENLHTALAQSYQQQGQWVKQWLKVSQDHKHIPCIFDVDFPVAHPFEKDFHYESDVKHQLLNKINLHALLTY
jgi:hypothetical protein